jgi:hypothetical protein
MTSSRQHSPQRYSHRSFADQWRCPHMFLARSHRAFARLCTVSGRLHRRRIGRLRTVDEFLEVSRTLAATSRLEASSDGVTHHRTASPTVLGIGAGIRAASSTELLPGRALRLTGPTNAGLTQRAHCAASAAVLGVGRYILTGSGRAAA